MQLFLHLGILHLTNVKVKMKSLSRVWPSATPRTTALQAPPPMGSSRQEYWSGVPLPSAFQCTWQILLLKNYMWKPYPKMIIERTLKCTVSKEQKSITEEIINLSCTHLCLDFCILLYRTQKTKWMYICPSNLVHHTDVVCLCPHITVLAHWAKIICLHICLTPEPGCLWMAEVSGSRSHLFL